MAHDIEIILQNGNAAHPKKPYRWQLSLPANAAMKDLLTALVPGLGLPTRQRDGRDIVYKLYHVRSDRVLSSSESLDHAGVVRNDVCLIFTGSAPGKVKDATPKNRAAAQAGPAHAMGQRQASSSVLPARPLGTRLPGGTGQPSRPGVGSALQRPSGAVPQGNRTPPAKSKQGLTFEDYLDIVSLVCHVLLYVVIIGVVGMIVGVIIGAPWLGILGGVIAGLFIGLRRAV